MTNPAHIVQAAAAAQDITLLVNNAGYAAFQGAIAAAGPLTKGLSGFYRRPEGPLGLPPS